MYFHETDPGGAFFLAWSAIKTSANFSSWTILPPFAYKGLGACQRRWAAGTYLDLVNYVLASWNSLGDPELDSAEESALVFPIHPLIDDARSHPAKKAYPYPYP